MFCPSRYQYAAMPRGDHRRLDVGLFTAAYLRQIGWDVDVYERSSGRAPYLLLPIEMRWIAGQARQ
jgi:hypothetical protein